MRAGRQDGAAGWEIRRHVPGSHTRERIVGGIGQPEQHALGQQRPEPARQEGAVARHHDRQSDPRALAQQPHECVDGPPGLELVVGTEEGFPRVDQQEQPGQPLPRGGVRPLLRDGGHPGLAQQPLAAGDLAREA